MKDKLKVAVGAVVKELRESRGITQQQLSDKAMLDQTTIAHLELGDYMPRNATWDKITPILGVEMHEIMRLAEERIGRKNARRVAALGPEEAELLANYHRCNAEGKKLMLKQADVCAALHPKKVLS